MGLFRKDKTRIIAKSLRTDFGICSHSGEGETPSYSRINTVHVYCKRSYGKTGIGNIRGSNSAIFIFASIFNESHCFNPIALRTVKTPESFGRSECNSKLFSKKKLSPREVKRNPRKFLPFVS